MPLSYGELIQTRFPRVELTPAPDVPLEFDQEIFDAWVAPDEALPAFQRFLAEEFPALVTAAGLELPVIISHRASLRRASGE